MDLGRAFSFPFQDNDWIKKVLIGGLIMLIPIIGPFVVVGWSLEVTRRVINREAELVPEWNAFGDYLVKGLKTLVIGLVYALPIILLSVCAWLPAGLTAEDNDLAAIGAFASLCVSCLLLFLGIFLGLFGIAATARFAATNDLGAAFRFGEIFAQVRANPMPYLMAILGAVLAGIGAGLLGGLACGIGALFTTPYAYLVQGHLMGQAYNEAGGQSTAGGALVY